ncbi:unnamed protein product [Spirodela intermedia]|uniref:DNL-type domain-containing protein n=1 Tax=Spirodela intermedia TaxID=51605 RepID=A0A7I8LL46_SPIIN|nr:unnamed protein product [Spirodela intermedia]
MGRKSPINSGGGGAAWESVTPTISAACLSVVAIAMDVRSAAASAAGALTPFSVLPPKRRCGMGRARRHLIVASKGKEDEADLQRDAGNTNLVPFMGNHGPIVPLSRDAALGMVLSAATGRGWTTGSGMEGPPVPAADADDGLKNRAVSTFPWSLFTKSPRRRMLIAFSCNVCGQRTTRAINPHAYTDGTVFVQCCGCNVFHKLVDNLNLFEGMKCYVNPDFLPKGDGKLDQLGGNDDNIFPIL